MSGASQPTYADLIDCLQTLAEFDNQAERPEAYSDLYYHARELAEELDTPETKIDLSELVENRAFNQALGVANASCC